MVYIERTDKKVKIKWAWDRDSGTIAVQMFIVRRSTFNYSTRMSGAIVDSGPAVAEGLLSHGSAAPDAQTACSFRARSHLSMMVYKAASNDLSCLIIIGSTGLHCSLSG
jgi:hypothetical protein